MTLKNPAIMLITKRFTVYSSHNTSIYFFLYINLLSEANNKSKILFFILKKDLPVMEIINNFGTQQNV